MPRDFIRDFIITIILGDFRLTFYISIDFNGNVELILFPILIPISIPILCPILELTSCFASLRRPSAKNPGG